MEMWQLRYYVAVVEAGSITAGARVLNISQPPLSLAITRLEKELGVKLLERTSRGVRPTRAGTYLLDAGSRIISDGDAVVAHLRKFREEPLDSISIGAVPILMWQRIPRFLRANAQILTKTAINLVHPLPWAAIDLLLNRSIDLAFIAVADTTGLQSQYGEVLKIVPWGNLSLSAIFPPGFEHLPDPVELSVFDGQTFAIPHKTLAFRTLPDSIEDAFGRQGITPSFVRTVDTFASIIALVSAGLAVSIVPEADAEAPVPQGLVVRSIAEQIEPINIYAMWRRDNDSNAALRRLTPSLS